MRVTVRPAVTVLCSEDVRAEILNLQGPCSSRFHSVGPQWGPRPLISNTAPDLLVPGLYFEPQGSDLGFLPFGAQSSLRSQGKLWALGTVSLPHPHPPPTAPQHLPFQGCEPLGTPRASWFLISEVGAHVTYQSFCQYLSWYFDRVDVNLN